jgi:hypothetical protein
MHSAANLGPASALPASLNPRHCLLSPPSLPLPPPLCNCIPPRQQFPAGCQLLPQRYPHHGAPLASLSLSLPGHPKGVVTLPLVAPPLPLIFLTHHYLSTRWLVVALPLIVPPLPLVLMACPCLSMHCLCHPSSQCAAASKNAGWLSHHFLLCRLCHSSSPRTTASQSAGSLSSWGGGGGGGPYSSPKVIGIATFPPPHIRNSACTPWMVNVLSFPSTIAGSIFLNLITWWQCILILIQFVLGAMFSAPSSPEMGGYRHKPHPPGEQEQLPDLVWLFSAPAFLQLPPLTGPAASGQPLPWDKEWLPSLFIFCATHLHLQYQIGSLAIGVPPHPHHLCHLHSGARICLAWDKEACSLLSASIDLVLLPFQRHVEVLAAEYSENGLREKMHTGERKTVR